MRSYNPREQRAFAHSARANANENPTAENIAKVLEYDAILSQGPRKSREMGASAVLSGIGTTHVAFVDWTAVSEIANEGNVGGAIIPKELADAVHAEKADNAMRKPENREFGKWHEALGYPNRWVAGTPEGRGVRFRDTIPLHEAIGFPTVIHDIWGSPRNVNPDETALAAIVKTIGR